jgi:phage-related minor tail protein
MSAEELEEPHLAALWNRLEDLWRSVDGATEHGHTVGSIASLRRKLREASLHRRLGLGDYEGWADLASAVSAAQTRLEPLLEELLALLDDLVDETAAVVERRS